MRNIEFADSRRWNPALINIKTGKTIIVMPHGSGIDCDWHCNETSKYFVFNNEWHAMDQNGMYCGYIPFTVYVPKCHLKLVVENEAEFGHLLIYQIKIKYSKSVLKAIVDDYEIGEDGESNAPYLDDLDDIIFSAIDSWQYFISKEENNVKI